MNRAWKVRRDRQRNRHPIMICQTGEWLTQDVGDPMRAQHLHSLIMVQRLALNSGFGWNRFVKMVDRALPKRCNTLELPFPDAELDATAQQLL